MYYIRPIGKHLFYRKIDNRPTTCTSVSGSKSKQKKPAQFRPHDLMLLKEAMANGPDYDAIAEKMSVHMGEEVTKRGCKDRLDRLLKQFRKDEVASLSR